MTVLRAALAVARIEWLRLLRTRIAFTLLLFVPVLQVALFGTAIRPQGGVVTVAIAGDSPALVARVAETVRMTAGVRLTGATYAPGGASAAVAEGRAQIAVELPAARALLSNFAPPPPIRVIVDATDPAFTAVATARLEAAFWRARAAADGPTMRIERLNNPDGRADWSFLPGLSGVIVMISTIMLGSLSLARERETGTWEVLQTLPVGTATIILGKLLPYLVVATIQGLTVLGTAIWLFDLPVRGNGVALALLLPLFAAAHLLLGFAIAARTRAQLAALQGAVAFYLPAMLLSGFLYPSPRCHFGPRRSATASRLLIIFAPRGRPRWPVAARRSCSRMPGQSSWRAPWDSPSRWPRFAGEACNINGTLIELKASA